MARGWWCLCFSSTSFSQLGTEGWLPDYNAPWVLTLPMTIRRVKAYTGQTGYVYQYYFVGKRPALANDPEAPSTEFIFDVTSDRKTIFAVSVFLHPEALSSWTASQGANPRRIRAIRCREAAADAGLR